MNNATVQLGRNANESTTLFCIWKPIKTRGQLKQRQRLQLAVRHQKKQAIKHRKQSTKAKKNLQPQHSRRMKKKKRKYFFPSQSFQLKNTAKTTDIRAILDSGFQSNLITEDAVQRLGLKKEKADGRVFGFGVQEVNNSKDQ